MSLASLNRFAWTRLSSQSLALQTRRIAMPAGVHNSWSVDQPPRASFFDRLALIRR